MAGVMPPELKALASALVNRGYVVEHPWFDDAPADEDTFAMLQLSEDLPGGQVWLLRLDGKWVVGLAHKGEVRPAVEFALALEGDPTTGYDLPSVGDQADATLRVLDRRHGDPDGQRRVVRALWPNGEPIRPPVAPPRLGANDPCWCGSGKKFKRCHGGPDAR